MSDTEIILNEIATVRGDGRIVARIGGFSEQEDLLKSMESQGDLVWNCQITEQDKDARKFREQAKTGRTSLAKLRLNMTRPLDAAKRLVMDAEDAISGRFVVLEEMADKQIKAEERRKADIAAQKERAEAERKSNHQQTINSLRSALNGVNHLSPDGIRHRIKTTEEFVCDDSMEEYLPAAIDAKKEVLEGLRESLDMAVAREEEKRAAAETARELEVLRLNQQEDARKQAEIDRLARVEHDRVAAENTRLLNEANARIAEHEEALRKQAEQLAESRRQAEYRELIREAVVDIETAEVLQEAINETPCIQDVMSKIERGTPQSEIKYAVHHSLDIMDMAEAMQDIITICKSRDILITKKIELILHTAQAAIGEPIA